MRGALGGWLLRQQRRGPAACPRAWSKRTLTGPFVCTKILRIFARAGGLSRDSSASIRDSDLDSHLAFHGLRKSEPFPIARTARSYTTATDMSDQDVADLHLELPSRNSMMQLLGCLGSEQQAISAQSRARSPRHPWAGEIAGAHASVQEWILGTEDPFTQPSRPQPEAMLHYRVTPASGTPSAPAPGSFPTGALYWSLHPPPTAQHA